jgi:LPXTG-site transpeptidase (sortase) family protein
LNGRRLVGLLAALAVVAVAVAIVLTVGSRWFGGAGEPATGSQASPAVSDSSPASTSALLPPIAKADPIRVTIADINVDAPVELYTVAMAQGANNPLTGEPCFSDDRISCVNPPGFDRAYWLKAGEGGIPFGDQAGQNAGGTVYLVGHAAANQEALFNNLYQLTPGATIKVGTANGQVAYQVQEVVILDKSDWSSSAYANDQVPGRLVIGTCYHGDDAVIGQSGSSAQNVLVIAQTEVSNLVIGG